MSKSTLYLVIGVLAVLLAGLGIYYLYEQSQQPSLELKLGGQSLTVIG